MRELGTPRRPRRVAATERERARPPSFSVTAVRLSASRCASWSSSLIGAQVPSPYVPPRRTLVRRGDRQTGQVRLATFNILHGRSPSDGRVNLDRFAAAVRALDADVLGLQEVDRDQPRSLGADLTAVAAEAMCAPEHRFVAALAGTPGSTWQTATGEEQPGTASYGIALLSRLPVSDWHVVRLPPPPARMPIRVGRARIRLVRDEPRVALAATVLAPIGSVVVVTTHVSFVPGWNRVQLRRLWREVGRRPGPAVLMGDLNMGAVRALRITRLHALATHPTYPVDDPRRQIDHILARGLRAADPGEAVQLPLSDHCALAVNVVPSDLADATAADLEYREGGNGGQGA